LPGAVRAGPVVAREEGQDFADGAFPAGGFGQRQVRLDLAAVAAAVLLLDEVAGSGQVGDDAVGAALAAPAPVALPDLRLDCFGYRGSGAFPGGTAGSGDDARVQVEGVPEQRFRCHHRAAHRTAYIGHDPRIPTVTWYFPALIDVAYPDNNAG
jgi:hypothetical protein